jgi:fructose-1,6-bisphosphatase II
MDRNLAMEFVRVTEAAALSCARLMGRGDERAADQAATEAMRRVLASVQINGTIVIGEGERDEAPMLYIGEKVGTGSGSELDLAVDPLEGTTILATGGPNALAVIASAPKGNLFHAPDIYMEKIAVGPKAKGAVDITKPPAWNLKQIADSLGMYIEDLTVVILNRPRHENLIKEVRKAGARIRLIGDGDVSAAIATCREDADVDVLMGIGGAPEGVIAAAALQCFGGDFQAVFKPRNERETERMQKMGIRDHLKVYKIEELASENCLFAATGVTTGDFLEGVRYFKGGARTHSVVMRQESRTVRYIQATHCFDFKPIY